MAEKLDLSILIVNWNTRELLQQCIQSILECWQDVDIEIIVSDNASSDGSVEMLHNIFPQVKVIANTENLGFVRANNQAAELATGRYILLLNSDTRVLAGGVKDAISYLDTHPDVGLITPKVLNADGSFQRPFRRAPAFLGAYFRHSMRLFFGFNTPFHKRFRMENTGQDDELDVDWVTGACVFMRPELLEDGKVFDEEIFMYYEDTLLCHRVWKAGYRVVYVPIVPIIHYGGESAKQVKAFAAYNSFKSSVVYFKKTRNPAQAQVYSVCVRNTWFILKWVFTVTAIFPGKLAKRKAEFFSELMSRCKGEYPH